MQDKDGFYFFWGGPFSQWASFDMEIDGLVYYTCEQYMMAEKAKLFKDVETYAQIMKEKDPKKQKVLGRQVKNFDKDEWEKIARDVVYKANYAKFTQHPDLNDSLIQTHGKEIVEASPYDCIWGIGLGENDKRRWNRDQWRGTNWLGEEIMKVRETLIVNKLKEEVNRERAIHGENK